GAADVGTRDPIKLAVADGTISSVALTSSSGAVIAGTLSPDKRSWSATEQLGYAKTYTWSGSATGADGKAVPITGSFRTVEPNRTIGANLNVGDGSTYGVAMPIVLTFDHPVTDKASVQKALSVQTSVPTTGAWAWLSDYSVHWRPETYWKAGTKVTVAANIYGVSFGNGDFGGDDVSAKFTIGADQVVKGNTKTHRLQLFQNGKLVQDFPTSYGLDSDPGRNTHSGIHVVMAKNQTYSMSNPKYHYKNVIVHWATRISNNGEFVHAYDETTWAQGEKNVSHGCANLTTDRAKFFFDWAEIGTPVDIEGSAVKLGPADGDYYDWTLDWAAWTSKSALSS
ncbi:MAG: L,D-transpeptidase family protein, partial [Sciscionella sp.]|nr:L,D-transpeptidase family protein [Sciscionella sp.]